MKKEGFLRKEQMSSEQRELAMLLKNKRIEQGRKLEDIASGICSTSYLSRIENNQVKLQDPYLRMLFEKLDINYDDLKKERQTNIFIELVKYQLLEQYDKYASKTDAEFFSLSREAKCINIALLEPTPDDLVNFFDDLAHNDTLVPYSAPETTVCASI